MSRAEQAADALERLPAGALAGVLSEALDQYALTRLWLVASHRTRPRPVQSIDALHCVICGELPTDPIDVPGGGLVMCERCARAGIEQ